METAIRYAEEGHDEVTSQVPKAEVAEAKVDEAGVSLSLSQVPEKEAHGTRGYSKIVLTVNSPSCCEASREAIR